MHSQKSDDYSMTDSNIIRCLVNLLKGKPIHNYTGKEQKVTQEVWKHITKMDETTFNKMTKRIFSRDINEVLRHVFTHGRIHYGRILSVYAFTAYCSIEHSNDAEAILRVFDNFYLNDLKP